MQSALNIWKQNRNLLLNLFESFDHDQLNHIPAGFNNNLIWNFAHIIAVHQLLIYKASGLPPYVSREFIKAYKMGSKPESTVSLNDIAAIRTYLLQSLAWMEEDLGRDRFVTYSSLTTSTGFTMTSLPEAIQFNNYHEALHLGQMLSMKRFV
ncbi:DinB family protein [Dyadobacter tibetensis]|uniref:DinB family protein n=1 Tax=Dyadobacter tibetensis TaxID=1211851 RepID=UPI00046F665A|nr:DinB family protein [Dyadobacter tibetensis]